MIAAKRICFI